MTHNGEGLPPGYFWKERNTIGHVRDWGWPAGLRDKEQRELQRKYHDTIVKLVEVIHAKPPETFGPTR